MEFSSRPEIDWLPDPCTALVSKMSRFEPNAECYSGVRLRWRAFAVRDVILQLQIVELPHRTQGNSHSPKSPYTSENPPTRRRVIWRKSCMGLRSRFGSSGRTRTYNPPVNRVKQLLGWCRLLPPALSKPRNARVYILAKSS